jgi:hypothetical protein
VSYALASLFAVFVMSVPLAAQATTEQVLEPFQWRNIGPANMGGRIVDIESFDTDFTTVYMATASGGVWKSESAGSGWDPIFDDYSAASIGDIAVFQPNPDIV